MIDYKEGDVVVCVNDEQCEDCGFVDVERSRLYTAVKLELSISYENEEYIEVSLAEITEETICPYDGCIHALDAHSFRKAYTPDPEVARERVTDAPTKVKEPTT